MDSDGDGLSDWLEQYLETSPGNPDSDYDGLSDSFELWTSNTSPLNWDSNNDGFSDHDAYYGCWNVNHQIMGYGATVYDWDGDGYYNPNDSWPFDSNNGSVPVPWSDIDGDGIHDNADPYPSDPLNGSSPPLSSDMDLDGIPDSMDTHPNDAGRWSDHNNNGHNDSNDTPYNTDTDNDGHFDGNDTDPNNAALWNDQFPRNGINDQDEPPPSSGYDPMMADSDGDGHIDRSDSHPGDASRWSDLNNNGFNDWEDTPYNMDWDNDGHFDGNDSDPDNGTLWNDHSPRDGINDPVTPPLTGGDGPMIADSDSDGRVDHSDSHPNDSARWSDWDNDVLNAELEQGLGTSPYHWDTDSDGLSDGEEVQYQTNPLVADMDGDGLTDREELLGTFGSSPRDKFSLSRGRGWGETYTDWHLADLTDTDGDGIPDKIEDLYAPYLNKQNAADAGWDADADGFTNLQAYLNGWTLRATINSLDRDGDGIEDAVEDLYPGILDKFNFADAVEDPDGDDLMNWQEVELPLQGYHPGDAQSRYAGVADHTARAWVALSGEVGLYLLQGGDWSSYRHLSRLPEGNYNAQMSNWVTMVDSDGTGLPDGLEAFLRDVAVEHGFVPGRVNPGDYDGDGMPDVWEWRYRGQLNLLSPTDAGPFGSVMPAPPLEPDASQFDLYLQEGVEAYQAAMGNYGAAMNTRRLQDLDADGLSNLMEYQLNTHPLIPDSDGDSIPDGVEYQYGSDPNNGNNLPTTLLEITGGSAQAAVVGAVSNSPLTVLAVRAVVPRGNYAVQFNTNGFGKLGSTMAGPWSTQLVSVTNDAGLASIYWQAPLAAGSGNLQVRGSEVGSAPQNISATAQPPTGGGDGPGPGDGTNPPNPGTSPVPVDPWEMVRIMERSRKVFVSRSSGGIPSGAIVISPNGTPTGYFLPRRIKSFDGQQEMNDFLEPLERLPSGHYVDRHGEHLIEDDLLNIPAVSAWAVTYGDLSETISPQTWFYGGGWSEGTDLSAPLSSSESVAATIAAGGIDAPLGSVLNELNMLLLPFAPADVNWRQLPVRSQAPYYCVEHSSGGVLPPAGLVLSLQSASGDEVGEEEGEQYQGRFLVGSKRLYWMARTRPLNANGDPDMAAELPELTQTWLRVVERVTDDFGNALPTTPELNANGNPNPGSSVEVLQMDTVTLVMPEDALTSTETRVNGEIVMVPPGTFPGSVLLSTGIIGTRVSLLPMEVAPQVLAVNTNFDEGDVDDETNYAKPDCGNGTLKAARDHLDGKWQEGDIVTNDLHEGFFGLRPGTLPYTETAGAVVKIKKLDKNDPETNRKQSGHVRLYAVWGSQGNESEMKIELYDKNSLVANDIGPQLYHQNPNTPVTFYLEGVEPGKITLEFSYQKGSTSFKHEQEFLVATHQTKEKWLKEIRYQLLLQTDGAVDLNHYLPYDGGWKPRPDPVTGSGSFVFHAGRVRAIYDYYGQLFEQWPEKLDWMGAARLVGGAVYGGLCDLQASDPSISVKDKLMGGQILIYRDLAWQHRAYVASGIWALEWVDENYSGSINGIGGQGACEIEVWRDFDGNIANNSWLGVKEASRLLVRREQQEVIAPMWAEMSNFAAGFVDSASNEAKNPVDPESPTFLDVVPNGSVANYADRDRFSFGWSHSPKGVFPVWWGETESSGNPAALYGPSTRLSLVRIPLRTRAALFAQFGTIY
jgi:hypothetical protein